MILLLPEKENETIHEIEYSSADRICKLATLKCYYHNVAEEEIQADWWFQIGYKKMWLEYDGIVEVGVDFAEVEISKPVDGIVTIYIPEAKVLSAYVESSSMNKMISDTGIFTTITAEDQANVLAMAQMSMKEAATNDKNILEQAHDNTKMLLKEYIISLGEQAGMQLAVEWSNKPLN